MHCLLTSVDDHITNMIALCGADVECCDQHSLPQYVLIMMPLLCSCSYSLQVFFSCVHFSLGFPGGAVVKYPPANVGEEGWIPGWGRFSGGGNDNPLQYSCLENSMPRNLAGYSPRGCKELDMTN